MQMTISTGSGPSHPSQREPGGKEKTPRAQTISQHFFHHVAEPSLMQHQTGLSFAISAVGAAKTTGLFMILLLLGLAPRVSPGQDQPDQTTTAVAQSVGSQGGISYSPAIPTGEFDDALGRTSQGIDLYLGVRAGSLPLYLGIDFDLGQYGSEEQSVDFLGVDGKFKTESFLYQPHLSVRYQSPTGRLRPFVEGLVGANVLTTSTTWTDFGATVEAPESADKTSVAFSVGAGIGLDFRLARVKPLGILGLTGSFHYIYGSEADVPVAEGVAVEEDQLSTVSTNTSVLQPKVGLYFEF